MSQLINIKGLGPKTEKKLNDIGIQTIHDLLFNFPMKYETKEIEELEQVEIDKQITLVVTVVKKPKLFFIRKNLDKLSVQVKAHNVFFYVHIFNRRFIARALQPATEIVITGRFLKNLSSFTASSIVLRKNFKTGIKPIYNISDIKEGTIQKIYNEILSYDYQLQEPLPKYILVKRNIPNINEMIYNIHNPQSESDIFLSKRRIVYEELLYFSLRIEALKKLNKSVKTIKKEYDIDRVRSFIKTLPFELTRDQKEATNEVFIDLKKDSQMNRLLQGDVGSGKTIISVISSLAVITAGFQVAIMAPTLVLAKQHLEIFRNYLKDFDISIELLTSDISTKEKRKIVENIKTNKIQIIIGTHALIQDDIDFYNLGFIVIDEQHRFGVSQRKILREKGVTPDILLMSATPIPRTLAISIYKDIDVSFIKEKPAGRLDILTDIIGYESFSLLLENLKSEINKGRQAYIICPKIKDTETSQKLSVEEVYNLVNQELGKTYSVDFLHGKLKDNEKTEVLESFYDNKTQILVSTTVVEVGVDVKNATTMIIMNADSFGLAQLHQLRGRIGRNKYQSFCYLVVDDLLEASDRLKILKDTNDGFKISEYDLSIRGPGEVFGNVQSGIPNFKMANLIRDHIILEDALLDAEEIIRNKDQESQILKNKAIKAIESYNLD